MAEDTIAIFNEEKVTDVEAAAFRHRRAVRVVIRDSDKNIALLKIGSGTYYSLPGGGVEIDETYEQGAVRESSEETGCTVALTSNIGTIKEYRKTHSLINESHGYKAIVIGEKGLPILVGDENEDEKNTTCIWVSPEDALRLLETTSEQERLYDRYCRERDLAFLKKSLQ